MKKMPPLSKYLKIYEKNPDSKVFAPLAESYRRLGMYQEAFKVLKKGLTAHPAHTTAQVILAHTYYDTQKYEEALKILGPLASQNFDNYTLQKLYANTHLRLGLEGKALEGLKHLLFLNPEDKEVIEALKKLEPLDRDAREGPQAIRPMSKESPSFIEEWIQVDFIPKMKEINKEINRDLTEQEKLEGHCLSEYPIVTHTLVDLYEQQGLRDKAAKVLEKIIELNPEDLPSMTRLQNLKQSVTTHPSHSFEGKQTVVSLDDCHGSAKAVARHGSGPLQQSISSRGCGNQALMEVWDQKFSKGFRQVGLKEILLDFLNAIKLRGDNEKSTYY